MYTIDDIREMFKRGGISSPTNSFQPKLWIPIQEADVSEIEKVLSVPFVYDDKNKQINFVGCNALDVLNALNPEDYRLMQWSLYNPRPFIRNLTCCKLARTRSDAVLPTKARFSDVGYDLTILEKLKDFNEKTSLYDTGIRIQMPSGVYAEVVPRSSLSKSGYMLANSVGIIDNSYTGNILIALTKIDPSASDITLPFRCCQLVFKHQVYAHFEETDLLSFDDTGRGAGGFGSTN
jgi:deoxyuridine 5'-triphosphate nucleotidohydrolase